METDKMLDQVITIIKEAGAATLSFYGQDLDIKDKGNDQPVTQADLASNEIIIKGLKQFGCPILSEESAEDKNRFGAERVWIVDPLDGTKDFIQETGEFTIMIGLVEKQVDETYRPILGVIYRPVTDSIYYAVKDGGAWVKHDDKEPVALKVSPETEYHNMVMLTSRNHTSDLEWAVAKELGIPKITTYGSSLKACLLAEQEGHVNFNPSDRTWEYDVCPSDLIIHEAGGKFTDCKGILFNYNKKDPRNKNGYLATNGVIHERVVEEIRKQK